MGGRGGGSEREGGREGGWWGEGVSVHYITFSHDSVQN